MNKKILLLGSQHGNELLGQHLYEFIARNRPHLAPLVTYKTGNPKAFKRGVRYIESDLNRSYNGDSTTYEERRAKRIIRCIQQHQFDIVLDLHTTTCIQPPCFIVAGINSQTKIYLRASRITRIVHMNHSIVMSSLIGVCAAAISIEVNRREATTEALLGALCDDIERYLQGAADTSAKTIYRVNDLLLKSEVEDDQIIALQNFTQTKEGFYPILVGENSYKKQTHYLGFKAYDTETVNL